MNSLVVVGDDFGLDPVVNEGMIRAHTEGILSAASLMVNGRGFADAVSRARETPSLRVGLHLVLVEGNATLPPSEIPDIVDSEGRFGTQIIRTGIKYFFSRRAREQLRREIRAQFERFHATGLRLDHVNGHNHFHIHPAVLDALLEVAADYGRPAIRVPLEPLIKSLKAAPGHAVEKIISALIISPWAVQLARRLRAGGFRTAQEVFGVYDSGRVTEGYLLEIIRRLGPGLTEIYTHPAAGRCPEIDRFMPDYRHEEELAALCSPHVRAALEERRIRTVGFADVC
ncbi:MAG: hopanoid biosynthesis-associated protein HpnK [Deltaproteobacteria bacterium]|nr:hopanoid biosynthesis-associated protein HpnK [Deltaproteobacteria bacterium]